MVAVFGLVVVAPVVYLYVLYGYSCGSDHARLKEEGSSTAWDHNVAYVNEVSNDDKGRCRSISNSFKRDAIEYLLMVVHC